MKKILSKEKTKISILKKGFTLVELMVVVSIMAIMSTLIIFNSSGLNSGVLLSNTVYEVGLIIRDAQVAGLGARVLSAEGGVATTSNQGVYFDITNPEKIIFFADLNKSNNYTPLPPEESQIYNIENKRAGKILKICKIITNPGTGTDTCTEIASLNIIFKRPNPEAYFYTPISGGATYEEYVGNVAINMGFNNGDCRSIVIYKTGAIQIDKSFCSTI